MVRALMAIAVIGCAQQSGAGFPGAYGDPTNLSIGPLAWLGARRGNSDGAYKDVFRWKQPVLLKPGHTATLKIGTSARGFAGLAYGHHGEGWSFASTVGRVRFSACPSSTAQSRTDGKPVTFWSGGIVLTRSPACVPVEIRIDRGRVRRRVLAYGGARC
jgi:hypothetical protein